VHRKRNVDSQLPSNLEIIVIAVFRAIASVVVTDAVANLLYLFGVAFVGGSKEAGSETKRAAKLARSDPVFALPRCSSQYFANEKEPPYTRYGSEATLRSAVHRAWCVVRFSSNGYESVRQFHQGHV
jgi:hypothetical protein